MSDGEPLLLSAAQAWRRWGVPRRVLYRAIADGHIAVIRSGRTSLVPRAEVERWIRDSARPVQEVKDR